MKPSCEGVGKRLRELREGIGWLQREVGEACDIGRKSIVRLEGESSNPTAKELLTLARFYEVSTDYILGLVDDPGSFWAKPKIIEKIVKVPVPMKFFNPKWQEEIEEQ